MYKYLFLLFILNLNLDNSNQKLEEAYFASGCFWCVESIYENLKGVIDVESGYSGGKTLNPTYYQVMTEKTGHAEADGGPRRVPRDGCGRESSGPRSRRSRRSACRPRR